MEVESVLHFLRENGLYEAELALKEDITEKGLMRPCDFEKFFFPMNPPLPPVKVPGNSLYRRKQEEGSNRSRGWNSGSGLDGGGGNSSENDEFVSLGSSTTGKCSSDFTNPYARGSATQADSDSSSDRLSQFGTAREYQEFDMQTDLWYGDEDDGHDICPSFRELDPLGPSEDKYIMSSETQTWSKNTFGGNHISPQFRSEENGKSLEDRFSFGKSSNETFNFDEHKGYYVLAESIPPKRSVKWGLGVCTGGNDCKCSDGVGGIGECDHGDLKQALDKLQLSISEMKLADFVPQNSSTTVMSSTGDMYLAEHDFLQVENKTGEFDNDKKGLKSSQEVVPAIDGEETTLDEVPFLGSTEDDYEVFNLRIIHRKNRTGFEENKDMPIVLNTMIAGRYYVTEYLGSAAFSKVIQAHDIQTGVDVCLKIIKNDKDFFDQSLDEIKILKYVNKHDPSDKRHILRLFDYFYHQEHLFIVCELLRANLYEFQKYNLESGGEPYFTMSRLQSIARQCLEALDFLHGLGIIHCDLKPENVLVKSYSRCEIKVIDLGSSCFQTDSLSLYVQSRSYRAPEVILGLPYGPKIDIWSLGCVLAELCSGEVLFPNDSIGMLLARMIGTLGPIDLEMLLRGQETSKYFTQEFDLCHINEETNQLEYLVVEESSLEEQLPVHDSGFIEFVKYLLQLNPKRRPTAKEALQHPWLSESL